MRNRFDRQLDKLNEEMLDMCSLCLNVIEFASKALFVPADDEKEYRELANIVYETDREIDRRERDVEDMCLRLLLQQQPVASDLRHISSALKMISDLERIGDQASDITELAEYIRSCKLEHKLHLKEMSSCVVDMVRASIDSFIKSNLDTALAVMKKDNEVDALFKKVKNELISIIAKDDTDAELCVDLLMVSKYFERIGDHAENIAEWVEYSITGIHKKAKN
ncbi:MAG: phosphate signaling complex protein PhoU [Eubacterium sp.]